MHTLLVFILISFLLGSSSTAGKSEPAQPSNLQLISQDFRILSRVTNAIALQAAAIRKDVKAQDLISELLSITMEHLNKTLNVNIKAVSTEFHRMAIEFKKYKQTKYKSSVSGESISLEFEMHFLEFLDNLPKEIQNLEYSLTIRQDELFEEAQKLKDNWVINNVCSGLNYESLDEFLSLFGKHRERFLLPGDAKIASILARFEQQSERVIECIDIVSKLDEEFRNLTILKVKDEYKKLKGAKKVTNKFATLFQGFYNFSKQIYQRISDFEKTRPIWEVSSTEHTPEYYLQIMVNFSQSIVAIKNHMVDRSDETQTYTAGFKSSAELLKVFDDLDSPWFRKKIARGASTKQLVKAFQPYRNISQTFMLLESVWKEALVSMEKVLIDGEVFQGVQRLVKIKAFAKNPSEFTNLMNEFGAKFDICRKQVQQNMDNSKFSIFEREQQPSEELMEQLKFVKKTVSKLKSRLLVQLTPIRNRAFYSKDFIRKLGKFLPKDITLNDSVKLVHSLDEVAGFVDYEEFDTFETIGDIAYLAREMKTLEHFSRNLTAKPTMKMAETIKELNIIPAAQCFNNSFKHREVETMKQIYEVSHSIVNFPSVQAVKQIDTYLGELLNVKMSLSTVVKTVKVMAAKGTINQSSHLVLSLKDSRLIAETIGLCTEFLEDLALAIHHREHLRHGPWSNSSLRFPKSVKNQLYEEELPEWVKPLHRLNRMLKEADKVEQVAMKVRNGSVLEMTKVFDAAAKVHGLSGSQKSMSILYKKLNSSVEEEDQKAAKYFEVIQDLNLDFTKYQGRLKGARVHVTSLKEYFDEIFGHTKKNTVTIEKYIKPAVSLTAIVCICIGIALLIAISIFIIYGFTEHGKAKYRNLYLYYFGKIEVFESRWRYSCFMDKIDMKNAILDAVREGNKKILLKALKNGAYVNPHSNFGNTALHVATITAFPELVELLIRYGADRTLLNAQNKTPEQIIPLKYEKDDEEKKERYEKIKLIYKKYEKKGFRISVPQEFPVYSFHIWMDPDTDNKLTNQFMDKFPAITSDDAMPTTTHVVVHTDENGIMDAGDNAGECWNVLIWIFNGAIIVKEQWMADCLTDEKLIKEDSKYLVESVKFKGTIYNTVLPWTQAMSKFTMPYLCGVCVAVVMKEYKNLYYLTTLVTNQGGIMLTSFPTKEHFARGARPYLHAHLGPLFLIHDGTMDLKQYKHDPDKMYTLFTEDEFMIFMLKRETNRDTRQNPIFVLKDEK